MRRAQRRLHRLVWPVLAALIALVFAAALMVRGAIDQKARSADALSEGPL